MSDANETVPDRILVECCGLAPSNIPNKSLHSVYEYKYNLRKTNTNKQDKPTINTLWVMLAMSAPGRNTQ